MFGDTKVLNKETFRNANERLERSARELVGRHDRSFVPFICECPDAACTAVVLMTLTEYADVRAHVDRGVAAIGHDDGGIERLVTQNERFVVTERLGRTREIDRERHPRER